MRKILFLALISSLALAACSKNREAIYIISTNDIHATIDAMPELATLVKSYEGQGEVILVDSGDRVSGNAYVDDATESGMPIIELMNAIGYDFVTLGNHEFDKGTASLSRMVNGSKFEGLCANANSNIEGLSFEPSKIVNVAGIDLGFVGVVSTDNNGYPLGKRSAFDGVTFSNDLQASIEACEEIAPKCDFVVLLSHMGLDVDRRLAEQSKACNWVAGGHTHDLVNEEYNSTHISQNNKNIRYVTIATLNIQNGEIAEVKYEQVDMSKVEEDAAMRELVDRIKLSDTTLNEVVARANSDATHDGVANLTVEALKCYAYPNDFVPEVVFYHFGGVRVDSMRKDGISIGDIFTLEPFSSTIYTAQMTTEQIRGMIINKFNDSVNPKESHRPDINPYGTSYTIVTDAEGEAIDVKFSTLKEGRTYKVAMGDYMYKNYNFDKSGAHEATNILVTEVLLDELRHHSPLKYTNEERISIVEK
jgi:5'-nucleotidase